VVQLCRACAEIGDAEGADAALRQAVELAPDDPATLRALAVLYREDGDHVRARALFTRYLQVAKDPPDRRLVQRYLAGGDGSTQRGDGRGQ
jgi:Flp pilus assembly protein TadD